MVSMAAVDVFSGATPGVVVETDPITRNEENDACVSVTFSVVVSPMNDNTESLR